MRKPSWPFTVNQSSNQANGLAAWWPFATRSSKLFELAKYNHASLSADPVWKPGNEGGHSLFFDGTFQFATADGTNLQFAHPTYSAWFNCASLPSNGSAFRITDLEYDYGISMVIANNYGGLIGPGIIMYDNALNPHVISTGSLPTTGQWHFVAATYDGSTQALYVDGLQYTSSSSFTIKYSTGGAVTACIGSTTALSGNIQKFNGNIEDVRLYNRALTAGEIFSLYSSNSRWSLRYQAPPRTRLGFRGKVISVDNSFPQWNLCPWFYEDLVEEYAY